MTKTTKQQKTRQTRQTIKHNNKNSKNKINNDNDDNNNNNNNNKGKRADLILTVINLCEQLLYDLLMSPVDGLQFTQPLSCTAVLRLFTRQTSVNLHLHITVASK